MPAHSFVNFYDILGVRSAASSEAVTARFRHLARRYHPDNQLTGDRPTFDAVVEAHDLLKDPVRRAQYHHENPNHLPPFVEVLAEEAASPGDANSEDAHGAFPMDGLGIEQDLLIQNNLLLLLYMRRRRNIREPGLGDAQLEMLSGCPPEHLEFHIWYLKAKGWIATAEDGLLAITIDGVERAANVYRETGHRLITDQS